MTPENMGVLMHTVIFMGGERYRLLCDSATNYYSDNTLATHWKTIAVSCICDAHFYVLYNDDIYLIFRNF